MASRDASSGASAPAAGPPDASTSEEALRFLEALGAGLELRLSWGWGGPAAAWDGWLGSESCRERGASPTSSAASGVLASGPAPLVPSSAAPAPPAPSASPAPSAALGPLEPSVARPPPAAARAVALACCRSLRSITSTWSIVISARTDAGQREAVTRPNRQRHAAATCPFDPQLLL